ncbi:phospholipase D-like domain-containing protein [Enhygromyxa salina]|uniref:Putative cardiolipin synthase YwiE n=1 Tax=Enhygromyxa salina TaxID=215803 RepID=A0A2S9YRI9_9BACT|nr:phosphatidylserine/phosphatidylglycerophosphate/cardiolipin synthase family protein [Enhygromyxa salina]PRQ07714.1 putative cardiolipin synthase YwiE [Enhygromyxa salina]
MPERADLSVRLRQIVGLFGDEAGVADVDAESRPLADVVAGALSATLERWSRSPTLRSVIGGIERDVLTSPGEWVELQATLGVAAKLGTVVRFYLDKQLVAEHPIEDRSEVRAMIRAPAPGRYRVGVELATATGRVGPSAELTGSRTLQVADGRPLALVHAELLLPSPAPRERLGPDLALLDALAEAGFEVAFFDIHEKSRALAIHEAMVTHQIPATATLIYGGQEQELTSLGVDFAQMFGLTAVRKLRAKGVPVTAIISEQLPPTDRDTTEPIELLSPDEAIRRARAGELQHMPARALAFREAWARADRDTWRLDHATGSTLVEGNEFHAELDNLKARQRVFELIDSATHSLHLQFYIVRPSEFTEQLIVALIRRARVGVRVRLMLDALYSEEELLGRVNPLLSSLRAEPNISVLAVERIESRHDVEVTKLKRRDHRKLIIIDGRRAIVSGRNASDEYYTGFAEIPIHDNTRHERIPWLDAHVEVAGPLVREVQQSFLRTWHEQGGALTPENEPGLLPELPTAGSAAGRLVVHHGLADANGLAMYESMLELANDHVYIVNDFPIVSALERSIRRLLARGVRVELLTGSAAARRADGSFFPAPMHRTLFELMVKARLEPLLLAGVHVYEFEPPQSEQVVARGGRFRPYVHAKLVTVDGRLASIGSANLDATASFWESEANVVVQDASFTSELEEQLRVLIAGSAPLDPESDYWRSERAKRAVVLKLWPGSLYS